MQTQEATGHLVNTGQDVYGFLRSLEYIFTWTYFSWTIYLQTKVVGT